MTGLYFLLFWVDFHGKGYLWFRKEGFFKVIYLIMCVP